jgi:hypothetical protein
MYYYSSLNYYERLGRRKRGGRICPRPPAEE